MSLCDDILLGVLLRGTHDDPARAHVHQCAACRQEELVVRALAATLANETVPEPPPGLAARVLAAATPVLAANARATRRPDWRRVARAVGVALVPLPAI